MGSVMKKLLFTMSLLFFIFPSSLYAIGLGVYTSGSAGSLIHKLNNNVQYFVSNPEFYTNLSIGGGIIFDSNISQKYLSYRFKFGVEKLYELQNSRYKNDYTDLMRLNFLNTITIPLIVNDSFKLWIGPQLNLHFNSGYYIDDFSRVLRELYILRFNDIFFFNKKKAKFLDVFYSFGVSLGFNIKLNNNFYLFIEPGFRGGFISQLKNQIQALHKYEYEGFIELGVFYKIGD